MVALSLLLYGALYDTEGAVVRLVVVCGGSVQVVAQHKYSVLKMLCVLLLHYFIHTQKDLNLRRANY